MENIVKHKDNIQREDRKLLNGHKSFVIWFTGLSGSGKSTIANHLERKLHDLKIRTYSLDGDNIRSGLNKDLSFSEKDRTENIRRIAEIARLFVDAGILTIAAFITPQRSDQREVLKIVGRENLVEVFVNTPLEVCEKRDVKGLYHKARQGEIKNFTGISSPFEIPEEPDIEVRTEYETVEESVERIWQKIKNKLQYHG